MYCEKSCFDGQNIEHHKSWGTDVIDTLPRLDLIIYSILFYLRISVKNLITLTLKFEMQKAVKSSSKYQS